MPMTSGLPASSARAQVKKSDRTVAASKKYFGMDLFTGRERTDVALGIEVAESLVRKRKSLVGIPRHVEAVSIRGHIIDAGFAHVLRLVQEETPAEGIALAGVSGGILYGHHRLRSGDMPDMHEEIALHMKFDQRVGEVIHVILLPAAFPHPDQSRIDNMAGGQRRGIVIG